VSRMMPSGPHTADRTVCALKPGFRSIGVQFIECGLAHLEGEQFAFVLVGQGSKAIEGRKVLDRAL